MIKLKYVKQYSYHKLRLSFCLFLVSTHSSQTFLTDSILHQQNQFFYLEHVQLDMEIFSNKLEI